MTGTTSPHFLLDTNAVIVILEGDPAVQAVLIPGARASVPIIVLGELYAGAENSARVEANIRRIMEFTSQREVLLCDNTTARQYARISQQLRQKGRPIPQSDMWIAATALQHSLILLTRDDHFKVIADVQLQGW